MITIRLCIPVQEYRGVKVGAKSIDLQLSGNDLYYLVTPERSFSVITYTEFMQFHAIDFMQ